MMSLRMCQLFYVFLCLFCSCSLARVYKHPISYISLSPSPPPDSADPPKNNDYGDDDDDGVFDVKAFGAVGDGEADDTEAFKSAWDAACSFESFDQSVSATILVPRSHTFMIQSAIFTGPCHTDLIFQVEGTIVPPDGPQSWPAKNSKRQWLVFYRVDGFTLQGGGVIDGRGRKWWELPCKPHKGVNGTTVAGPCDSPVALRFFKSSDLTVTGLKFKNSPQFHFRFDECNGVHIENIVIKSPALSPNTDGIHIENTNSVEIYNSVISNGDDCVSIGSGCYDVDIKNITCGPSHGISIGSLGDRNSRACVSNITVRDTTIKTSDNGVRIKTWQGGYGSVSDIKFNNIHMENVRNPIIIDQFYCATKSCTNQTSAILISDITYSNIKGTYDVRSPPIRFMCSDSIPCLNLTVTEVELLPAKGEMVLDPYCWNAYGGGVDTLTIPPISCLMDGVPPSIVDDENDYC